MKQVRYIAYQDRVLIDVGPMTNGTTFFVADDFADNLVASRPDAYELVVDAPAADPVPEATPAPKTDAKTQDTATTVATADSSAS